MINKKIINFYKKTSSYTYLGLYQKMMKSLPDDIKKLCLLQRKQMIHPSIFLNAKIRNCKNCFWGDMTEITNTCLLREDDILPTAISMIGELLRKNKDYSLNREAKYKIFVTCRGQAILLAATLKAKGIAARVRSGFAQYPKNNGVYWDHWITEYYNEKEKRWILVDADCCCNDNLDFNIYDIPRNQFITAAQLWMAFRKDKLHLIKLGHAYYGMENTQLIEILTTALFYDFHCLMNNEIIYVHLPKYLKDKKFLLDDDDYIELDQLATAMLDPDKNFHLLEKIWNNEEKFRVMIGGTIH